MPTKQFKKGFDNMSYQTVFKRYEIKYLISKSQQEEIKSKMSAHMNYDKYGKSTICNIYFDTPSFLLIRRSIEKPIYKEKLRLRSYGVATGDSTVFLELKKKYNSVVYKRRMDMSEKIAMGYLCESKPIVNTQITREIDYFRNQYENLQPAVFLSYEREAFYSKEDSDFRITFDENILWRDYELSLCAGVYGEPILDEGQVLMEIKTGASLPLWMVSILSENQIYKTTFSKYERAYRRIFSKINIGGICYV